MALTCGWCSAPATKSFQLEKPRRVKAGFVPARTVPVCEQHFVQLDEQRRVEAQVESEEQYPF